MNTNINKKAALALAAMLMAVPFGANAEANTDKDAEYLAAYYGVTFGGETVSAEEFSGALTAVFGADAAPADADNALAAVKAAVIDAQFEELALSYPAEKTAARLAAYGVEGVAEDYAAYLATALDVQLVAAEEAAAYTADAALTKEQAETLLMNAAQVTGNARHFLGESDDADIYEKLQNVWNSFILFDDAALSEVGKTAVQNKVITGFNVKNEGYDAHFLPEYTLKYGHSNIKHANQLIGLLNSEGITAKVQLEPKVSVYEYLLDWGPVPAPSPVYEVKQFSDDLYLCYAVEYDLQLEFATKEEMLAFNGVIEKYAKKYAGNEAAVGLISGSWWQPLYSSRVAGLPEEEYKAVGDFVITNGIYYMQTFYLNEDAEAVEAGLSELAGELETKTIPSYVNRAFHNYLTGADYQ